MDPRIESFRFLLGRKEYDKLDDIWLELADSDADPEDLFELAVLTERYAPPGKAEDFLWVLADALKERKQWDGQFDALKRLARLNANAERQSSSANEARLSSELAANLRQSYADAPELERLLQKSGLSYGRPLKQALDTTERYLHLLPGSWLYSPDWGACRVEKLDFLLDRVTVRCAGLTEYTLGLDTAHRRLRHAGHDGYFRRLSEDRPALAKLAAENPAEVVLLYLRDTGLAAGAKEMKAGLSELVAEPAWDGFWNRARKELDAHPHVQVHTKPSRSYQWSDERIQRAEEVRTQNAELRSQKSGIENPEDLARLPEQEAVKAYEALSTFTQRRRLIEALLPTRAVLVPKLFVLGKDNKLRSWLEQEMPSPEAAQELLNAALTGYRDHPDAFLWLAGTARAKRPEMAPGIVSRIVDLSESLAFRRRWPRLTAALVKNGYDLLRTTINVLEEAAARNLHARLARVSGLEPYQQDEIRALFAERFPDLARDTSKDAVLATTAGIERARNELARLTNEEIPRSAEEIGRARAHGDLSENYEYKAAKEKQARLMQQARKLRKDLTHARPIAPEDVDCTKVSVGCRVKIEDQAGAKLDYAILGPWDSDPDHGIISYLAPLGQKLLGRKPGESVELEGRILTVKKITAAPV